jgi:hypothetical protein
MECHMQPLSENALDDIVTRERDRGAVPLTDWDSLSTRLRAEGLIRDRVMSRVFGSPLMKIAAGLVLAAGGAALGRASAGAPVVPSVSANLPSANLPSAGGTLEAGSGELTAVSGTPAAGTFSSPEEAWAVLNRAGDEYQRASAYLSERTSVLPMPRTTEQYRTRLAALDNVMSEMRDAMRDAPQDPVINQYYLATVGAREATLKQLGNVLPASARLNRF